MDKTSSWTFPVRLLLPRCRGCPETFKPVDGGIDDPISDLALRRLLVGHLDRAGQA